MSIVWEEYIDPSVGDATQQDLLYLESALKVSLPEDYKNLILDHQGKMPTPETIESGKLASSVFGPLFHVMKDATEAQELYSVIKKWEKWSDVYENIIPIAGTGGSGCFFAYDYRNCTENPPVVFVDVEEDPDDEDAILFVTDSLSELIDSLS
ncbi:SMI1/KNR4 family protein [Vibrio quintilis]|uniref:SMI1 / KNR4 family protein n=1 Tax=Vibrio quintilis TaxID=1117707 RepID=A0A1M7Z2Q6_9VIBR|nr:SMI1/KNR4 family protein [Vibrio quintilis]SHO59171.1 SMI1 / KNR4 family protein [Vibrio quintilis]